MPVGPCSASGFAPTHPRTEAHRASKRRTANTPAVFASRIHRLFARGPRHVVLDTALLSPSLQTPAANWSRPRSQRQGHASPGPSALSPSLQIPAANWSRSRSPRQGHASPCPSAVREPFLLLQSCQPIGAACLLPCRHLQQTGAGLGHTTSPCPSAVRAREPLLLLQSCQPIGAVGGQLALSRRPRPLRPSMCAEAGLRRLLPPFRVFFFSGIGSTPRGEASAQSSIALRGVLRRGRARLLRSRLRGACGGAWWRLCGVLCCVVCCVVCVCVERRGEERWRRAMA